MSATRGKPESRRAPDLTKEPVDRLKSDFESRKSTLDDDLSFIQEVVTGASTAIPDFNPEVVRTILLLLCVFALSAAFMVCFFPLAGVG